jgi:hypothetical protein
VKERIRCASWRTPPPSCLDALVVPLPDVARAVGDYVHVFSQPDELHPEGRRTRLGRGGIFMVRKKNTS